MSTGLVATRRGGWESALGALVGLGLGSWAFAIAGLWLGAGYQASERWRQRLAAQDGWDADVEPFLEQLPLVADAEPSLARAVDRALPPHLRPLARRLDTLGSQLAAVWPVPALSQASRAWQVLSQHGGSVGDVARQMLAQLRLDRRLRWERTAALAGGRGGDPRGVEEFVQAHNTVEGRQVAQLLRTAWEHGLDPEAAHAQGLLLWERLAQVERLREAKRPLWTAALPGALLLMVLAVFLVPLASFLISGWSAL